jgi:Domain of unknown function DUF11
MQRAERTARELRRIAGYDASTAAATQLRKGKRTGGSLVRLKSTGALAVLLAIAASAPASASTVTIGSLASSDPGTKCESIPQSLFIVQTAAEAGSYTVPAGGGIITSWSTSFGEAGAPLSLIVVHTTSNPTQLSMVGSDSETLPTPIAADHISTFTPASPILTEPGDIIGLQLPGGSKAACFSEGGVGDDVLDGLAGGLTPGSVLTTTGEAPTKILLNVSATITQSVDLALSEAVTPSSGPPGVALIALTPSDLGPAVVPATVTDVVPSGLAVLGAATSGGECSVAGQAVTCELGHVPLAGAGTPPVVDIVVSSSSPGVYSNQALIQAPLTDSNPANNATSATFTVTAPVAAATTPPAAATTPSAAGCNVVTLKGTPLTVAEAVLGALHCTVGKVAHVASKTVAKGLVIGTAPGAGAHPAGTKVAITVSSGKPKPATRKHKRRA